MRGLGKFAFLLVVLSVWLAFVQPASANTFCVPTYSAACPASGINEAEPDLNAALSAYGADGNPDKVIIAPGTLTATDSFTATGNDPLEIIGSGREKTFLTSSASGGTYVLNLGGNNRTITVKDLAVVVPTSFDVGAAVGETADHFESVDLITRNEDSFGVYNPTGGSTFKDIRVFGQNGASFGGVFYQQSYCLTGGITFSDIQVSDAQYGLVWNCPDTNPVTVNRAHFTGADAAIQVSDGALVSVTNSLIESGEGSPIRAFNFVNKPTTLNLNHLTVVATGDPNQPAIHAWVDTVASPTQNINLTLENSIISGFTSPWHLEAPIDQSKGNVILNANYTATDSAGTTNGQAFVTNSNIPFGVPHFVGFDDFHLAAGSPGIDQGDPTTSLPDTDLDGKFRPVDGNADGVAVRDLGAYEFQPTCADDPAFCPPADKTAPKISKVKFSFKRRKGGTLKLRLSEASTVRVTFTPVPKKSKPKRKKVKLTRKAKAGNLTLKIGKRKLGSGRYKLTITATDKAGNKSKTVTRKVRVRV